MSPSFQVMAGPYLLRGKFSNSPESQGKSRLHPSSPQAGMGSGAWKQGSECPHHLWDAAAHALHLQDPVV